MLTNIQQHQQIDSHQKCPGCQTKRPTYINNCDNCKTINQCKEKYDQCCDLRKPAQLKCNYNKCEKQDICVCYQTFIINPPKIEEIKGAKNENKKDYNYGNEYYFNLIINEIDKHSKCECCTDED